MPISSRIKYEYSIWSCTCNLYFICVQNYNEGTDSIFTQRSCTMEKLFKLKERGTDVRTEIMAGITTFMTMAYILAVNPGILSASGMGFGRVFAATAITSAIATLVMGLLANLPFALSAGMGLN